MLLCDSSHRSSQSPHHITSTNHQSLNIQNLYCTVLYCMMYSLYSVLWIYHAFASVYNTIILKQENNKWIYDYSLCLVLCLWTGQTLRYSVRLLESNHQKTASLYQCVQTANHTQTLFQTLVKLKRHLQDVHNIFLLLAEIFAFPLSFGTRMSFEVSGYGPPCEFLWRVSGPTVAFIIKSNQNWTLAAGGVACISLGLTQHSLWT